MARASSADSGSSTLSCINVTRQNTAAAAAANTEMGSVRSSVGAFSSHSTPPTSLDDMSSEPDASKDDSFEGVNRRRSGRARSSISTYNDKVNAGTAVHTRTAFLNKAKDQESGNRTVSGATLVDDNPPVEPSGKLLKELDIDMHWSAAGKTAEYLEGDTDGAQRRRSVRRGQLETAASSVADAVANTTSSLGKRMRDAAEYAKDKLLDRRSSLRIRGDDDEERGSESPAKRSRLFPNLRLGENEEKKQEKEPEQKAIPQPFVFKRKKYLKQGLYVGQHRDFDPKLTEAKNRKRLQAKGGPKENSVLPLPMFVGEQILKSERDYKLPFDICNPRPREEAPRDWHRLSKNRFIGDASASWRKEDYKKFGSSTCNCYKTEAGVCGDDCMNRNMWYECEEDNCRIGENCGNRAFAELKFRARNRNWQRIAKEEKPTSNLWGEGVEVVKTKDRGYGVRAMRSFEPGQIIVEYTGEIITLEESDRRMNEDYKEKTDYYLMEFHDGMIIDATRGSICRFVNHSCEPNCRVEKWTVAGEPRMALFAGDNGIVTGEELTYDYNFEAFSKNNIQTCLCGSKNCRGVLGPKPAKDRGTAAKAAAAVTEAVRGVKRKVKEVFGKDNSDDETGPSRAKRTKTHADPKALLKKATNRIANITASSSSRAAVQPISDHEKELQDKSRKERAARRSASLVTLDSRVQEGRVTKRRSISTTFNVYELRSSPKKSERNKRQSMPLPATSRSPAKTAKSRLQSLKENVKKRGEEVLAMAKTKSSSSKEDIGSRNSSFTKLLTSSSSLTNAGSKQMRQSRISFGPAGFGYSTSPKKQNNQPSDDEEEEPPITRKTAKGPKIPKRGSSLAATSASARPTTARPGTAHSVAKSVKTYAAKSVKGPQRAAAVARVGLKGEEALRKTIRHVSGAE